MAARRPDALNRPGTFLYSVKYDPRLLLVELRSLDMERQLLGIEAGPPNALPPETQVEISDLDESDEVKRLLDIVEGGTRDPLAQASDRFPRGFGAPQ